MKTRRNPRRKKKRKTNKKTTRERQRGGQKGGGGQNLTRRPPVENSFRPPSPRYVLPPPYSISLSKSLRNAQNFPSADLLRNPFSEGLEKWFSDRPSSRGFAFRYVLPPPLALPRTIKQGLRKDREFNICELSGPVLRDTARLSQRYPPYCALCDFWCLNMANWVRYPLPFLSVSPLESMRSGGAIPPQQKGYLSDTCAIPYGKQAKCVRYPPSAILSRKGVGPQSSPRGRQSKMPWVKRLGWHVCRRELTPKNAYPRPSISGNLP